MSAESRQHQDLKPISPSADRDLRLMRRGAGPNPALANIVDEDRVGHREEKRREATLER